MGLFNLAIVRYRVSKASPALIVPDSFMFTLNGIANMRAPFVTYESGGPRWQSDWRRVGWHPRGLEDVYKQSEIRPYATLEEAILDLAEGRLDAVIGHEDAIAEYMKTRKEAECCVLAGNGRAIRPISAMGSASVFARRTRH
jgi:hypothetical protein